jgi:hypothetical protein
MKKMRMSDLDKAVMLTFLLTALCPLTVNPVFSKDTVTVFYQSNINKIFLFNLCSPSPSHHPDDGNIDYFSKFYVCIHIFVCLGFFCPYPLFEHCSYIRQNRCATLEDNPLMKEEA